MGWRKFCGWALRKLGWTVVEGLPEEKKCIMLGVPHTTVWDFLIAYLYYKSIGGGQRQRTYLTIDEVKRLIATPTRCVTIKRAFLFACFTGLRISDLSQLRWKDIHTSGKDVSLSIQMKKTRRCVCIPLSTNALRWLPTRCESTKVFPLPSHLGAVNAPLKTWVRKAGIDKTVTFHTSRHTFATMEITLGADLYVVSKLLGHSSITTTQIYADIVDSKRIEAVRLMDNAF